MLNPLPVESTRENKTRVTKDNGSFTTPTTIGGWQQICNILHIAAEFPGFHIWVLQGATLFPSRLETARLNRPRNAASQPVRQLCVRPRARPTKAG